jgi:hypothetical protein
MDQRIRVKPVRRRPPDLALLSEALIRLALAVSERGRLIPAKREGRHAQ